MKLKELIQKLKKIKAMGFVKTKRAHQGGVGNTLEDLLGIKENNIQIADIGEIELKAKRKRKNQISQSMLSLFTKSPNPRGVNKILFNRYSKKDSEDGVTRLYTTVTTRKNNKGLKLKIKKNLLVLENPNKIDASWDIDALYKQAQNKIKSTLLVLAETKGGFGKIDEEFHYNEAHLLKNISKEKFISSIRNGHIKVDIRIGADVTGNRVGHYHDHGTGFRILEKDFLQLFKTKKKLF